MSGAGARVRSVVLGLGFALASLLLLDLSLQLSRVSDATTAWWAIAVYLLIGALVATTVVHARRDPLIPAVAAVVLFLAVAPALPEPLSGLPLLPVIGEAAVSARAVIVVLVGACVVGAIRGRSGA